MVRVLDHIRGSPGNDKGATDEAGTTKRKGPGLVDSLVPAAGVRHEARP